MSIQLEHDKETGRYFLHDFIDGWLTGEITKEQYERFKKEGVWWEEKQEILFGKNKELEVTPSE